MTLLQTLFQNFSQILAVHFLSIKWSEKVLQGFNISQQHFRPDCQGISRI